MKESPKSPTIRRAPNVDITTIAASKGRMTTVDVGNADEFLDAFSAIEKHVRGLTSAAPETPLMACLKRAAERDAVLRRFTEDLREFNELRNALVHNRKDNFPIAVPLDHTVDVIRSLRSQLETPPLALTVAPHSKVRDCSPHTPVADAAQTMRELDFSQLPVVDHGKVTGLLTAETVSRWLAVAVDSQGGVILAEHTVAEALSETEDPDHQWVLVGRNSTAADALERFYRQLDTGRRLDAVLITASGQPHESLLGILTAADTPLLSRALNL